MEQKGIIVIYLEKLFGKSWKTSVLGIMVALPQILQAVQVYCVDLGVRPSVLNSVSLVFAALAAVASKSQDVVGTNRPAGTGEAGPKTA